MVIPINNLNCTTSSLQGWLSGINGLLVFFSTSEGSIPTYPYFGQWQNGFKRIGTQKDGL